MKMEEKLSEQICVTSTPAESDCIMDANDADANGATNTPSHAHGPKCGHAVIHHMTTGGRSHLAFINGDASVECFDVEATKVGCCNMLLTKLPPQSSCSLSTLLNIDALHKIGDGMMSSGTKTIMNKHDCSAHGKAKNFTKVAEGAGYQILVNDFTGELLVHTFDLETGKYIESETGTSGICKVLGSLVRHNLNEISSYCERRQGGISSMDMENAEDGDKSNRTCSSEPFSTNVLPSACTGIWNRLFHSSQCSDEKSYSIVPTMTEQAEELNMCKLDGDSSFVRSEVQVNGLCCANEVPIIDSVLKYEPGISLVRCNPIVRKVTVQHDPSIISCTEIVKILNAQSLDARIITDGAQKPTCGIENSNMNENPQYYGSKYPHWTIILGCILLMMSLLQYVVSPTWMENFKFVALGSVVLCLPHVAYRSFERLRRGILDVTTLMTLACIGGIALGEYSEAAAVITLYTLSDWLEATATKRVRIAVDGLLALKPETAILAGEDNPLGAAGTLIRVEGVPIGCKLAVPDGENFPIDGVVVSGETFADESALTGESKPIRKNPGSLVSAGTINVGGSYVEITTTTLSQDSVVARMVKLVEEADANRSPTEQFVGKIARVYTPIIFALALSMATIPWAFGKDTGKKFFEFALVLLVVGCPCALVISTPITYVCGLAHAARNGILIKGGRHLEALGSLKSIALDKTGTLTKGKFTLKKLEINEHANHRLDKDDVLRLVYTIEKGSTHPIAAALCAAAENAIGNLEQDSSYELLSLDTVPGEGLSAKICKKATTQHEMFDPRENPDLSLWTFFVGELETGEDANIVLKLLRSTEGVHHAEVLMEKQKFNVVCDNIVTEEHLHIPFDTMGFDVVVTRINTDSLCRDGCCMKPEHTPPLELRCQTGCCENKAEPDDNIVCEKGCCAECDSSTDCNKMLLELDKHKHEKIKFVRWFFQVIELATGEDARIVLKLLRSIDTVVEAEVDIVEKVFTVLCAESTSEESLLEPFYTMGFVVDVRRTINGTRDDIGSGVCKSGSDCCSTDDENDVKHVSCESCSSCCVSGGGGATITATSNSNVDDSVQVVYIGNKLMATRLGWTDNDKFTEYLSVCEEWESRGFSYCILGYIDEPVAIFCIGDEIREEAKEAVAKLHKLGIRVVMLTGDNAGSAKSIAQIVGVREFYAGLRPEGKKMHLGELERKVAMVGDGINDALSLASADVSIAMGCIGSTIAIETADVALMEDNLLRLEKAVRLGRVCLRKIKQNVIFSIAFKVAIIAVTFGVPFPSLWLAISSDVGAMLLVTLNSMSVLGTIKPKFGNKFKSKLKQNTELSHIGPEESHIEAIV